MKKKKWIFIGVIFVLLVSYFAVQGYFLKKYWLSKEWVLENKENRPQIVGSYSIKGMRLQEEAYQEFFGVKLDKALEKFELLEANGNEKDGFARYVIYDENKKVKEYFALTIYPFYEQDQAMQDKITKKEIEEVLEKYKIKTSADRIQFLEKYAYTQNHIFMLPNQMKENYIIQTFLTAGMIEDKITILDGALKGYRYSFQKDGKEYCVVIVDHKNCVYQFLFQKSNMFTEEFIDHLIETAIFD